MITEFIGQGLTDDTDESVGNHLCSALNCGLFKNVIFFVAFLRSKGLKELKPFIEKSQKEGTQFTVFVGIDEKVTSKEGLEMLIDLGIDSYIYNSRQFIYHPKVYLFEGDIRNRIIIGSSNLTKTGLFYNMESSILLDFTNEDKSGNKVLNQLKEYFEPLLEFSSDNLEKVTTEYISYLVENSLISIEKYDSNTTTNNSNKGFKNPKIGLLGDIEITEGGRQPKKYKFKITEEYLEKWDSRFDRMKAYKEKYGRTTVSKTHPDKTLFGWYQKQKLIFNDPDLEMPKEHLKKLRSIDFFFGDGHDERSDFIKNKWITLLKQALADDEEISQIHSYTYKGETLGTWLQESKTEPETRKLIELAGFDYSIKSRRADHSANRFIQNLKDDLNPKKSKYQTVFNSRIIHRKDKIPVELVEEINKVWLEKFNEERSWNKKSRVQDYTPEWKAFRYDKEINPEEKWFKGKSHMGEIYEWVWGKKKHKRKMDLVIDKFNEQEKMELKNEGFPID